MNSLVRQLKLHALVGEKAVTDGRISNILTFFVELFDGMECSILPDYSKETLIFHKGDVFYMEWDSKNDCLWCRYDGYWSFFADHMSLSHVEIPVVVKYMVERHLKQGVGTPFGLCHFFVLLVERHLKQGVGTPQVIITASGIVVERHLKQGVGTPQWLLDGSAVQVERHLKQRKEL